MTKKGKRAKITPEGRAYILARALQLPRIPRTKLAESLQGELKAKQLDVPEVEVLERMISQARNHPLSPLDEQWSVACLAHYGIPPEALPAVLYIYEKRQREYKTDFTIREVLWIARLHKTIDDLNFLELFASRYALRDKIDWILDNPANTRGFDFILLNYLNPERRAEVIANLTKRPDQLDPFPSFHPNYSEEVMKRLKQKGYDIEPPPMVALKRHVEEVWQQGLQATQRARTCLEQKKPEELTEEDARYLKWAKVFLAKEAQNERVNKAKR